MKHKHLLSAILFLSYMLNLLPIPLEDGCGGVLAQTAYAWAKGIGGATGTTSAFADVGTSVAIDANGNVYTTGYFKSTVDFDPDPVGIYSLSALGHADIFISKLDASGNFVWAKAIGSTAIGSSPKDVGNSIALDGSGNIHITGYFAGTVDFDPDPVGTYTLSGSGVFLSDMFVCKLDAFGNFVWAKQMIDSPYPITNSSIAVDDSGNVYTTGSFSSQADFNPDGVTSYDFSAVQEDMFVSKLDASGNFVWAKSMPGGVAARPFSIAVDGNGVYTTGVFTDIVDFDPGTGSYVVASNGYSFWSSFISKLSTGGDFVWAKIIETEGGTGNVYPTSIALDNSGNVYTTGYFGNGIADFDPDVVGTYTLAAVGGQDIFVSKLDSSGKFVWAKNMGGLTDNSYPTSIAINSSGSIYTTGSFAGTADFDPDVAGTYTLSSTGDRDIFVSELNVSGNFVSARLMGGTNRDEGNDIAVDFCGNVYTTGSFAGTADFNPDAGSNTLTSFGNTDIFVSKLASTSSYILPQPVITPSGPIALCFGDSIILNAGSGFLNYQWIPGSITTPTITVASGSYSVVVSNACGSNTSNPINITINPLPTVEVTQNVSLCIGQNISLSAGGATTFVWSPDIGLSSTTGDVIVAAPPTGVTTYTVTGTDANGCVNDTTVSISMYNPVLLASPNVSVCSGVQTVLTCSGLDSYVWYPSTGLTITTGTYVEAILPAGTTTTYTITGTYTLVTGCFRNASVSITVHNIPLVNAGQDQFICIGDSASLTATGTGGDYIWSPTAYFTGNTGSANVTAIVPATANTYTCNVLVLDTITGCSSANDTVLINVVTALTAAAGQDISIACGTTTTLTGLGGLTFAWSPATGLNPSNSNMPVFDPTAVGMLPGTYTYSLIVASGIGCVSAPDEVVITVDSITANAGQDVSICSGASANLMGTGDGINFIWSPETGLGKPDTNNTKFNSTESGVYSYSLTVSAGIGCVSEPDEISITVIAIPTVDAGLDTTIRQNSSGTLHASGNAQSYSWNPSLCNNCLNPTIGPITATGQYIITASNGNNCTATDTVTVFFKAYECEVFVPNAFSPNGDGQNDSVKVYSYCIIPEGFAFRIFDRWGTLVFESFIQDKSWDGKYSKEALTSGSVFVFTVSGSTIYGDRINEKGDISLVR